MGAGCYGRHGRDWMVMVGSSGGNVDWSARMEGGVVSFVGVWKGES